MFIKLVKILVFIISVLHFSCNTETFNDKYDLDTLSSNKDLKVYISKKNSRKKLKVSFWKNGNIKDSSYYFDDLLEGEIKIYTPESKLIYIGNYRKGKKTGIHKTYDMSTGKIILTEKYSNEGVLLETRN